jgi:heptosyltransferase-2
MPASREYVSSSIAKGPTRHERILIVSPSWMGDCIMAMPAILEWRRLAGPLKVVVLAKPAVAPLWRMSSSVDEVLTIRTGFKGTLAAVNAVKGGQFDFAYVIPNSFRSALIPFLAKVRGRRGYAGHFRRGLLTECVRSSRAGLEHQSREMFTLLGIKPGITNEEVLLRAGAPEQAAMDLRLELPAGGGGKPMVVMFPGAARGSSKRWPEGRFADVGRRLAEWGCRVVLAGTAADRELCGRVAGQIGSGAITLAGATTLAELVALLSRCRVVIANDSGGMHLAAAVGTRVVAVFGVTDPVVTGPMGAGHIVLMAQGFLRGRDVGRDSKAGHDALAEVTVDAVYKAAVRILEADAIQASEGARKDQGYSSIS